MLCIYWTG